MQTNPLVNLSLTKLVVQKRYSHAIMPKNNNPTGVLTMATPRKSLLYISSPGEKPVTIDPHEFAKKHGFTWTDEIVMSDSDQQSIEQNIKNLSVTNIPPHRAHSAWTHAFISNETTQQKAAIYDTKDPTCGYGLIAVSRIKIGDVLFYPGEWSFGSVGLTKDSSYVFTLKTKDNATYGNVDGMKYRHLASFAMNSWDPSELNGHYTFASLTIKNKVATANLGMIIIPRPQSVSNGRPFVLALQAQRDIEKDEPLTWTYSDEYFLESPQLSERFFSKKGGAIIDPSQCSTQDTIILRIKNVGSDKAHYDITYEKKELASGKNLEFQNTKGEIVVVYYADLKKAIDERPRDRFINIMKPSLELRGFMEQMHYLTQKAKGVKALEEMPKIPAKKDEVIISYPASSDDYVQRLKSVLGTQIVRQKENESSQVRFPSFWLKQLGKDAIQELSTELKAPTNAFKI